MALDDLRDVVGLAAEGASGPFTYASAVARATFALKAA
jgi:hypothetical protein